MARLPVPGNDYGLWGEVLNDYLNVEHAADGSLKIRTDGTLSGLYTKPDGGIPESDLSGGVQGKLNAVAPGDATASSKGIVQLAGDLGGTADAPTVPGLAAKADDTAVVHIAGTETITGDKNFTGALARNGSAVVETTDARLSDQRTPADLSVTDAKVAANAAIAKTKLAAGVQTSLDKADSSLQPTTFTTKGDILAASGPSSPVRLGVGSDGQVITADSTQTTGMRWGTASTTDALAVHQGDLFINVKDYGAVGDNVALDSTAINNAIAAAGEGDVVYFPPGIYRISSPIQMKRNLTIMGPAPAPRWSYKSGMPARVKIDTATWSGDAMVRFEDMEQSGAGVELEGAKLLNIGFEGVAFNSPACHGIYASGHVQDVTLLNVGVWNVKGDGIRVEQYTRLDASTQGAAGWRFDHVSTCWAANGFYFNRITDSSFYDCLAVAVALDGFYFNDGSDNHLTGCRAVFGLGYGYVFTGSNGSLQLASCSTDRNVKDGFYLNCNDSRHVITMTSCYARRDGCNDNVTPDGYAGLRIVGTSGATPHCPVVVTAFGAHVAKGDNNDGLASPDYGIRIDTAARVSLVGCIVAGTVAGIQDNTASASIIGCKSNITNSSFATTYDPTGRVIIQGNAGADREVQLNTAGSGRRWAVRANGTAESGSNAGSDFTITRYGDTGTLLETALLMQRSTGHVGIGINTTPSARMHMERADGGIVYLARQTAASNTAAIMAIEGQSATSAAIQVGVQGDTIRRYGVKQDGTVEWGPGAAGVRDTNLYRSSADTLKTDDALTVTDAFTPKVVSGAPTDGSFLHTPPNGTFAVDNTNSRLYIRLGGVWKSVTLT